VAIGNGATGSVSGNIEFRGAAHKLTAANANGITFNSGSLLNLGTGFSGNVFGNTAANSVVFKDGATYAQSAGSNPFGLSSPSSVVVFESGSLFKATGVTPALSGRTYANFELDCPTCNFNDQTGASALIVNDLSITNGLININLTGAINIKGNINVASGATLGFNPASAATVSLNGTVAQTVTNNGTLTFGSNNNLEINNSAGVTLTNTLDFNKLTIRTGGILNLGANNHTASKLYIEPLGFGVDSGTWGSTSSAATNKNDTYFGGTGMLNVSTSTLSLGKDNIAGFSLYPNPVKGGKVFINSANNYAERTVQVFDVLGKQVVNQKGTQNSIDVSHLNKGVYIMKVTEEGKVATRKLVIE